MTDATTKISHFSIGWDYAKRGISREETMRWGAEYVRGWDAYWEEYSAC